MRKPVIVRAEGEPVEINLAVVKAMRAISWVGVRELGYSESDVARCLGVTNFCVTRLISAEGKRDIDDMNLELCTFCTNVPYSTSAFFIEKSGAFLFFNPDPICQ